MDCVRNAVCLKGLTCPFLSQMVKNSCKTMTTAIRFGDASLLLMWKLRPTALV